MSEPVVTISLKEYEDLLNKKTGKPRAKVIPGLIKKDVLTSLTCIGTMSAWRHTPQGFEYWEDVSKNLAMLLEYEEG